MVSEDARPVLIVTGASRGLGAAIAQAAARLGADLALIARSQPDLDQVAQSITDQGHTALILPADVAQPADCREIVRQTVARFGRIDGLVNNAGVIEPIAPIAEANAAAWERSWRVNLLAPVLLIQAALPYLLPSGGRVIQITSGAAVNPVGGWGAYGTTKAALNHLTAILAAEEPEITALAVRPGTVETQMQATIRQKGPGHMAESNYEWLSGLHEQGRLLPPETPGTAIAVLTLHAPHAWTGKILSWDDERVARLVEETK